MASADKSITQFDNGTLTENSLFAAADVNAGTGYASTKHSASAMGAGMCGEDFIYAALKTSNKSIFAAINELNNIGAYKTVTGTLTAGQTSITLQDANITEDSLLTFYTNILGVNPISESHTNGSVTLTFEAQATDMVVAVNIMGAHGGAYSLTTILSASVVGNDDGGILPISRYAIDDEYFDYNSTTHKWTCKKEITNAICVLFVRAWKEGDVPTSQFYVNDSAIITLSPPSGSLGSHAARAVGHNFTQGDTLCISRPNTGGWNEPHILIYFLDNTPFENSGIDWNTGYNDEIISDLGLTGLTYDYKN